MIGRKERKGKKVGNIKKARLQWDGMSARQTHDDSVLYSSSFLEICQKRTTHVATHFFLLFSCQQRFISNGALFHC